MTQRTLGSEAPKNLTRTRLAHVKGQVLKMYDLTCSPLMVLTDGDTLHFQRCHYRQHCSSATQKKVAHMRQKHIRCKHTTREAWDNFKPVTCPPSASLQSLQKRDTNSSTISCAEGFTYCVDVSTSWCPVRVFEARKKLSPSQIERLRACAPHRHRCSSPGGFEIARALLVKSTTSSNFPGR